MRSILEAMHDYPDEALGLFFFLMWSSGYCQVYSRKR